MANLGIAKVLQQRKMFFFVALLLWPFWAVADPVILLSKESSLYNRVSSSIVKAFKHNVQLYNLPNVNSEAIASMKQSRVHVAVGVEATEFMLKTLSTKQHLIAIFLPESSYRLLRKKYKDRWLGAENHITAIYLNQPLSRQLHLAKLVLPDLKRIGTALGPSTVRQLDELKRAAEQVGAQLVHTVVKPSDNPIRRLQPVIQHSDVFIPVPDSAVFNRTTAKWILYIAYRKKIPLIGFSKKYADAGAVAAVYSTPSQLGRQAGEWLTKLTGKNISLPVESYPQYFSVSVNKVAARSLLIQLPNNDVLMYQLEEAEK